MRFAIPTRLRRRLAGLLMLTVLAATAALGGCAGCANWERVYNPVCQL